MRNLRRLARIENVYNLLVQVDYLAGLTTAYLLGSCQWVRFFVFLAISLTLGIVTVLTYIKMMKVIMREANNNEGQGS